MAKPSIFSRDYEKKMRRRKRRFFLLFFLIIVIVLGIFLKVSFSDTDFSQVKDKIQAWIDSDKIEEPNNEEENKVVEEENKVNEEEKEEEVKEENKYIDLTINEDRIIKVIYSENNGEKIFMNISEESDMTGLQYDISPSKKLMLVTDERQNVYLFNTNGEKRDITRASYVSQNGDVYLKDNILQGYEGYVWQEQVKFIDDNKIAYVSQLPYFGSAATNKYVWVYDILNNIESCLWGYTGTSINIGTVVEGKGLQINIDGIQYYINSDGHIIQ